MKQVYSNVRGTADFSTGPSLLFRQVDEKTRKAFKVYGYEEIILPILEEKDLFVRGVGESTDIIERQMFKIEGKDIILRPEGTAQVVRYYLQNSLYKQGDFHKFFYAGPMFRGERPQKGRLRQFHHLGAEAIGSDSFYLDAEMIILCLKILDSVGLKEKELKINTLGCAKDKGKFSVAIKKSLFLHKNYLCRDCENRLEKNPLRILDCKNQQCKKVVSSLALGQEHLCQACRDQFKNLLFLLDNLDIQYIYVPRLVRGLDYYTNTVFEVTSTKLGAQDAIGAGGRYNNLIKFLGGPDIPAIGFALGVERILLALGDADKKQNLDIFVAVASVLLVGKGFSILNELRHAGFSADFDYRGKSLKGQLRSAQKRGVKFVIILGEKELKDEAVLLKDMGSSVQEIVKIDSLVSRLKEIYKTQ